MTDSSKYIILGDLHFGVKGANLSFYEKSQLTFFVDLLIPYMKEHNIKTIIQLGDFLDNRTTLDIRLWKRMKKEILDVLQEEEIQIYTLLGNHDISYRNTLDTSFIYTIDELYDNFHLISTQQIIELDEKCLFVPWMVPGDKIDFNLLQQADKVFGHFEMQSFELTKGHFTESGLDPKNFNVKSVKKVYSGHYHIKQKRGKINYVGTPYQINFGDYNLENGFFIIDSGKETFIPNNVSSKFIKLKYNDKNEKPLEISGLRKKPFFVDKNEIPYDEIRNCTIKMFINKSKDSEFEEYIYNLKQNNIEFEILNNQEISLLIGDEYIETENTITDTTKFVQDTLEYSKPELKELFLSVLQELQQEQE